MNFDIHILYIYCLYILYMYMYTYIHTFDTILFYIHIHFFRFTHTHLYLECIHIWCILKIYVHIEFIYVWTYFERIYIDIYAQLDVYIQNVHWISNIFCKQTFFACRMCRYSSSHNHGSWWFGFPQRLVSFPMGSSSTEPWLWEEG